MMHANSVQKFAYFCFSDFEPKLFSQIKIVTLTTTLLQSQMKFLMFPSLEIMELKLRAEILALNWMLSLELM